MVNSTPSSPGAAAASAGSRSRQDTGANLLQELEALSQALYKASQAQNVVGGVAGPTPRKERHVDPLQRRHTMPVRPMNDVFSMSSHASTDRKQRTRHSSSSVKASSVPVYEEYEQDGARNRPRESRKSTGAPVSPMFSQFEEEPPKPRYERKLQPWHSQGFERNPGYVANNFPEYLEDDVDFSRKLEVQAEKKKKSIWNWQPFRTLSHIGHTRYSCLFTVHVHAIEGVPQAMNGLRLTVQWRHKDRTVQTMPSRVFQGSAEFEETLQLRCSVYGSKSSAQYAVKFMPKAFTLGVVALDVDELMLGQHRLDLSRLLPETPEHEHDDSDKPLTWTTSFKLAGKAKGGTLVVTFGYEMLQNEKGERSGRFGSVIGSMSPSLGSPSPRSSIGGSRSTHGTPRPRPPGGTDFLSPTMSEPSHYPDFLGMEHLNLDESPSTSASYGGNSSQIGSTSQSGQPMKGFPYDEFKTQGYDFSHAGPASSPSPLSRQAEERAIPGKDSAFPPAHDAGGDSDDDREFVVVDQGVEVSSLPEDIQYPEHNRSDSERSNFDNFIREASQAPQQQSPEASVAVANEEQSDEDIEAVEAVRTAKPWDPLGTFRTSLPEKRSQESDVRRVSFAPVRRDEDVGRDSFAPVRRDEDVGRDSFAPVRRDEDVGIDSFAPVRRDEDVGNDSFAPVGRGEDIGRDSFAPVTRDEKEEEEEAEEEEPEELHERSIFSPSDHVEQRTEQDPAQETVDRDIHWSQPQAAGSGLERGRSEEVSEEMIDWETPAIHDDEAGKAEEEIWEPEQDEGMWGSGNATEQLGSDSHNNPAHDDYDDDIDLIAGDFLSMLEGSAQEGVSERGGRMSTDSEIDSPRASLLKQFEQEAFLEGGIGLSLSSPGHSEQLNLNEMAQDLGENDADEFGLPTEDDWRGEGTDLLGAEGVEMSSIMEAAEYELQKATQTMRSKTRAKMLEDAETEALMQEWGLNEKAFENSPVHLSAPRFAADNFLAPQIADNFGGPQIVDNYKGSQMMIPPAEPMLAKGVGPVVEIKDGGTLRSMSPSLFSQSNSNRKLVMQVSKPVVVPLEMGASGLDILRRLASSGVENMALQAMTAMPLEDITGKSVQEIAYEAKGAHDNSMFGQNYLLNNGENTGWSGNDSRFYSVDSSAPSKAKSRSVARGFNPANASSEFVSLEELAPMAMQKIEALAMDGLKIQADMSDESAPYTVDSLPGGTNSSKLRKGGALDGGPAMQLLDLRGSGDDGPAEGGGLMAKLLSLDEWMQLDAGHSNDNATRSLLAANGHENVLAKGGKNDRSWYSESAKSGRGGFMGRTVTMALLIQLRDPLQNNEPIGAPMMALVQAERFIVPPAPKISRRIPSQLGDSEVFSDEEDSGPPNEPAQPQFKITAVHMSGLKASEEQREEQSSSKKETWGNPKQQQLASRWLSASGMGKVGNAFSKLAKIRGKPQSSKQTEQRSESLWSISSKHSNSGSKWKDVSGLKPHIRNPDVVFAN